MADSRPAAYDEAVAPPIAPSTLERVRPHVRLIALLSVGHFVIDQLYLPRNAGMASGLIVGFATGTGALA